MKNIALLFGSSDSEHDISIESACSVMEHFPHDRYRLLPIYMSKSGVWYLGDYSVEDMHKQHFEKGEALFMNFAFDKPGFYRAKDASYVSVDACFLMLHGRIGEGGYVQGLLEVAKIPYTGCGVLSSALCMDKIYTHKLAAQHGIPMADYQILNQGDDWKELKLTYPCIVKPAREGSSFGVSFVHDEAELEKALAFAFSYDHKLLIESYIDGTELGVGILDVKGKRIVSDVDQVNVSGDIFDFQEKYHPHHTVTLAKTSFNETIQDAIQGYANAIFDILDCRHFARIDFFVDKNEQIFLNEVNTIPGFTSASRYPKMIARKGIPYTELIALLIEGALL